ncbi:MAG: hypothetical protein ACYSX0_09250 [Planctomycetota bacterium]
MGTLRELFQDPVEALQRILASRYGPKTQLALVYIVEGAGYRYAARLAGLGDHRDLHRAASKLGLAELHADRKRIRDTMHYSKRDRAAIEAVLRGDPSWSQLIRASEASWKRIETLEQGDR